MDPAISATLKRGQIGHSGHPKKEGPGYPAKGAYQGGGYPQILQALKTGA
jgi:hypothetical protein